jgi:hypothetical protein
MKPFQVALLAALMLTGLLVGCGKTEPNHDINSHRLVGAYFRAYHYDSLSEITVDIYWHDAAGPHCQSRYKGDQAIRVLRDGVE